MRSTNEKLAFAKWYIQKVTITHFGSKNGFVIQKLLSGFFEKMNLVLIQYLSVRKSNWPYPHQKVAILIEKLTHKVNFRIELRGKTVACSSSPAVCRDFAYKEFSKLYKNFCASCETRKIFTKCLSSFFAQIFFFQKQKNQLNIHFGSFRKLSMLFKNSPCTLFKITCNQNFSYDYNLFISRISYCDF